MKKMFRQFDTAVTWTEDIICAALLVAIVCISGSQMILRYFFSRGILWGDEVNQALMVALGMFGCAKAIRCNGHTELTSLLRKPKSANVRIILRGIVNLIALVTLAVLFWSSIGYAASGTTVKSVVLRIPRIWFYISMPVGFGLAIYEFLKIIKERIMNDPPEDYDLAPSEEGLE